MDHNAKAIFLVLALSAGTAAATTDTFNASGTWTAPAGVTSVTVEAWGGGGAGGGATGNPAKGGGGAGGQYATKVLTVVPGNSYAVSVGAGGTGSTGNGTAGGDSTFGTSLVVAKGGAGGTGAPTNNSAGTAGTGSTAGGVGDTIYAGGSGTNAVISGSACQNGGAGGGGAGSTGTGGNAAGNTAGTGTTNGGGDGGAGRNSSGSGNAGTAAGGAGGGACAESNTDRSGGAGADGMVTVTYTPPCLPPSNIPAGVTVSCQCDNFGRASLNPSTIFGGSWATSHGTSDSAGTNPYINATTGLLRLTENTNNNAKAATVPGIFPAAGNFISVEFMHYAYQGGNPGADGIAVTLSDYSVPAVPGGFGGSLGYAQRTDGTAPPGFAGGWVGVALDEYGNYQNATEGRVGGPGAIQQSVGVRGPGSGGSGYRWMGGTGSNPGGLSISANSTTATPAPGYMYQVIVDARNETSGTVNITVNRDATAKDGSAYTALFGPFNAYTEASYALSQGWISKLVPDYWQISFTGSTGGSTNVHEIGALRICAQTVFPPTGGTASGFSAIDEAYPAAAGSTVPAYPNFQTGHIYTKLTGTAFKLWVAALSSTGISTGYSAAGNKYVQVKLVDNSDGACAASPSLCGSASCQAKTAVETGATQVATFVSGSSTGVASPSPTFTLNSAYKNLTAVMKECTTSTCTAFTTTAPACSADAFSVRPLSVASVTSTNATNTGTSGTPTFKAASGNFALTATITGIAGYPNGYTGVLKIDNSAIQANSPATNAGVVAGSFGAATSATPSSTATGSTFTYSEVGSFILRGYNPASNTSSPRGVFDGVNTTSECAGMTTVQCDTLRAATWTGIDSVSTRNDCVLDSYANSKDTSGKYGCNFGIIANTAAFGRFIPDHFDTAIGFNYASFYMDCPSGLTCPATQFATSTAIKKWSYADAAARQAASGFASSDIGNLALQLDNGTYWKLTATTPSWTQFVYPLTGFVYSAQPFAINVYARNGTGGTTKNYDSSLGLSKTVTLSAWTAMSGATSVSSGSLNNNSAANFSSGNTELANSSAALLPNFTFTTVPTAPTDIYLRAIDTDGVTSLRGASSVEGGVKVVSGRIFVSNGYGSELLPLPLNATLQYWNGSSYAASTTDNVNTLTAAKISRSSCTGALSSSGSCNSLGTIGSVASVPATPPPYGAYSITLNAPGSGNTGSENLVVNQGGWPAWLPSVGGRATFGIYSSHSPFIYLRESY